jgi:hypothetical protein
VKKLSGASALLAGLAVLVAAILLLTLTPGLRGIGLGAISREASRMQSSGNNIGVTSAPYSLPDYMWDIEVKAGETTDLKPLIPAVATVSAGILSASGIRLKVGEAVGNYNLELQWDTGAVATPLALMLFDCLERPVGFQKDITGKLEVKVPGGLYKLVLSCEGRLDAGFALTARATETDNPPEVTIPAVTKGIPTLAIQMSEATYLSWDIQRAALLKQLRSGQAAVDTTGFKKVLADVVTESGRTTVQLWDSGVGIWINFSEETPSFTGKVVAGPLLFGMSRFKLHSIRTQEGLLDYTVESLMYDEGLLEPRCILVRASLNGREMGLYRLVEDPKSDGFFAGVRRYDGQLFDVGNMRTNPAPPAGFQEYEKISRDEEFSAAFAATLDKVNFARTLAFSSRFQATHGLTVGNLWFYRHPYLGSPEPLSHDLNVHAETEAWPGLLVHTGWWLGTGLIEGAPYSTPALFPRDEEPNLLAYTPWTIPIANAHPAVHQFLKIPENRELFDRYLLYAADPAIQRRFAARMQSAFTAARPFLTTGESLTLPGFGPAVRELPGELSWLTEQVGTAVDNRLITPRTIPALLERSRLLVDIDPPVVTDSPDTRAVSLYNLSPFSARLSLPEYARVDGSTIPPGGWYLSPSLLFPAVVSVDISEPDVDSFTLTGEAARRFLSLERLRFSDADAASTLVPFIDVRVPAGRYDDFLGWLEANSAVTLGSAYLLPTARHIMVNELTPQAAEAVPSGVYKQDTSAPDVVMLPLSLEESAGKYCLSLLVSNFSSHAVTLELASLRWLNQEDKSVLPTSRRAIWRLGEAPIPAEYTMLKLGAAGPTGGPGSELDSAMVWTGALRSFLAGPADNAVPNCALVEVEFAENGTRWLEIDANDLAKSAASSGVSAVKVVVFQLNQTYLPIESHEGYRSLPSSATLSVSDFMAPHTGDCLVDRDLFDFWHVANPQESTRHWVTFEFSEPLTINGLAILPRSGATGQFWDQDHAIFQGSNHRNNESSWVGLARLAVDKAKLSIAGNNWLNYIIHNTTSYKYYRILIDDPSFFSIAEVKFQASEWGPPAAELTITELLKQGVLEIISSGDGQPPIIRFKEKEAVISGVLTIPRGYVLELEPGDSLRFTPHAGILSYSPLRAIGTAASPVILAPVEEQGTWAGVAVVNATGTSEFRHVGMSRAAGGTMGGVQFTGGLSFMGTSVVLADIALQDFSSEDGLHMSSATFEISRLVANNSRSDAVDSDWSYGHITDVNISGPGGDALDFSGSLVVVRGARLDGAVDKGVSVGEGCFVTLEGVSVDSCHTGIAVKDASFVTIAGGELAGNRYGLLRYIKKPTFTYPDLAITEMTFSANGIDRRDEPSDQWTRRYDN